jgi:hypothetical protein
MQSIYHLERSVVLLISRGNNVKELPDLLHECGLIVLLISLVAKFKQHHHPSSNLQGHLYLDHSHHQGHLNHSHLDPNRHHHQNIIRPYLYPGRHIRWLDILLHLAHDKGLDNHFLL